MRFYYSIINEKLLRLSRYITILSYISEMSLIFIMFCESESILSEIDAFGISLIEMVIYNEINQWTQKKIQDFFK